MKLKVSEIIFVTICLCAAIAAVAAVHISRANVGENELVINHGESVPKEEYDVSVINAATQEDFMQVSGVGEVKAGDIIAYRTALGGFTRVSQIKDISGIGDSLYQRIVEHFYPSVSDTETELGTYIADIADVTDAAEAE